MIKRLLLTFVTIFSAVFLGVFLSGLDTGPVVPPEAVSQSESDISKADPTAENQSGYYIIDYNGRVSILKAGEDVPEMIFNIYTRTLPELDQEQLQEGVFVESYEDLMRRVEDYIS